MRIERLLGCGGGSAASRTAVLGLTILLTGTGGAMAAAQTQAPVAPANGGSTGVAGALANATEANAATSTRPTGPIRLSAGIVAGMLLNKPNPVYPAEARMKHVQGSVILYPIISKTGTIEDLKVISGPDLLRDAAVDAVSRWTYMPYILDGSPAEVETSITVNFTFGGAKPVPPPPPPLEALHQSSEIDMLHEGTPPVVQSAPAESDDAGGAVKKVGGGVSAPVLVKQVEPQFSPEAKQNKIGGPVAVSLIVDEQGMPQKVHVSRGVGNGLDEKAVEAVKQYRFKPAMENGQPVAVYLYVEVNFEVF